MSAGQSGGGVTGSGASAAASGGAPGDGGAPGGQDVTPQEGASQGGAGRPWASPAASVSAAPDSRLFRGGNNPPPGLNPASDAGEEDEDGGQGHGSGATPWSQPPQRATAPVVEEAAVPVPPSADPSRSGASATVQENGGPTYHPTATPQAGAEGRPVAEPNDSGAVYRAAPVAQDGRTEGIAGQPGPMPPQPGPQQSGPQQMPPQPHPQHPGPHQTGPQTGSQQPGPQQPGPQQAGPQQPGPQQAYPQQPGPYQQWPQNGPQQPPAPPGPYPPQVDPRAVGPRPQDHQQPSTPPVDPYQQLPWVSDGTPTAEEFARRRLAKPVDPTATMGPRAMLQKTTMGLVRLAPGKREQEYKQDVEMVRRNFGGLRQVTVVNPKGGAGKTVAVLLLAMTFGQKRGGYVLAWDNNETQGTLGMRAQQDFHARTVRDMMRDLHLFRGSHGRVGDLSQYVRAQGEGMFDVLASDESATAGEMLTATTFAEIREIVSRFYKLIFVDTGNNVRAQNWQAAMDATDQLVITMSARNDSAETAARMLDHLEQSGRQRLVRQAVTVVSIPSTRKDIDLPAIQRHFAARTRAVLLAPYEKLIDSGEPLRYGQLSTNTRDSWLKIAAAVAEGL
nr:ParA family protein [Actinoplanes consettensis]